MSNTEDFEAIMCGVESPYMQEVADWGEEKLDKIRRAGYVMTCIVEDDEVCAGFQCVLGSPAHRLNLYLGAEGISNEEKLEIKRRYILDAATEDEDYMRKQWSEVQITDIL